MILLSDLKNAPFDASTAARKVLDRFARPVVVVSDVFWRTRFGSRDDVLDQSLTIGGVRHRVIGVMLVAAMLLQLLLDTKRILIRARNLEPCGIPADAATHISQESLRRARWLLDACRKRVRKRIRPCE